MKCGNYNNRWSTESCSSTYQEHPQLPGRGHTEAEVKRWPTGAGNWVRSVCQNQSRKRARDTFMVITYKLSQGKSMYTPKLATLANYFKNHTGHRGNTDNWKFNWCHMFELKLPFLYISSLFLTLSTRKSYGAWLCLSLIRPQLQNTTQLFGRNTLN